MVSERKSLTTKLRALKFKDKSRILHTYREKKLWKEKIFVNEDFSSFDFIHQERKSAKKGGGILIYLKNHIKFKIIKDLSVSDSDNECVTIKTEKKNSKNLVIICCYRPPCGAIRGLNSFLEKFFKMANAENRLCFVVGDFNLNCLKPQKKKKKKKKKKIFKCFTIKFLHMVAFR